MAKQKFILQDKNNKRFYIVPDAFNKKLISKELTEQEQLDFTDKQLKIVSLQKIKNLAKEQNISKEDADNLFGSITLQNIVDRLVEDGYAVAKKQVSLPSGAIKTFAEDYIATVSLHTDINVTVPIKLTRNNVAAPEPVIDDDAIIEAATDESSVSE